MEKHLLTGQTLKEDSLVGDIAADPKERDQPQGQVNGPGCPSTCLEEELSLGLRPVGPDWKA